MKHPNQLRKYRLLTGLSEKQVADYLGLKNEKVVADWEKGETMPNSGLLIMMLAAMYHVHLGELYPKQYMEAAKAIAAKMKKNTIKRDKSGTAKKKPKKV